MQCPKCGNKKFTCWTDIVLYYPLEQPGFRERITKSFIRKSKVRVAPGTPRDMLACTQCGWTRFLGDPHWKTTAELLNTWKKFYEFVQRENPDILYTEIDELYKETKEYLHNVE